MNLRTGFVIGNYYVRAYTSRLDLPGVSGWIGVWAIYHHPRTEEHAEPVRIGDTHIQSSEAAALAAAKAMAGAIAQTL